MNDENFERIGPVSYYALCRVHRDLKDGQIRAFTEVQLAERDTNLMQCGQPKHLRFIANAISIVPNCPDDFLNFISFISGPARNALFQLKVAGQYYSHKLNVESFWVAGEYLLQRCVAITPVKLEPMTMWAGFVEGINEKEVTHSHKALQFRFIVHGEEERLK